MKGIVRRRKWMIVASFLLLAFLSAGAALLWPPMFHCTAELEAEIPAAVWDRLPSGSPDRRLEPLASRVLTRPEFLSVAEWLVRPGELLEQAGRRLRERLRLRLLTAEAHGSGGLIRFAVEYSAAEQTRAAAVLPEVVSLFLREGSEDVEGAQPPASLKRVQAEAEKAERELAELGERYVAFKKAHLGELPENTPIIAEMLERMGVDLDRLERRKRELGNRKQRLEARLTEVPPIPVVEEKTEGPVKPLEPAAAIDPVTQARLAELKNQLGMLQRILGLSHPDVVRLTREVEQLSVGGAVANAAPTAPEEPPRTREVPNPEHGRLTEEIAFAEQEMKRLEGERLGVERKMASYRQRLAKAADVEARYAYLAGEYEGAKARVAATRARLAQAQSVPAGVAPDAPSRFRVVGAGPIHVKEVQPNRRRVFAVGLVASVVLALGLGVIRDRLDRSVKTADELVVLGGVPVLAAVPVAERPAEKRARRVRYAALALTGCAAVCASAIFVHCYLAPFGVLLARTRALVAQGLSL
jgi:hypothetical protein